MSSTVDHRLLKLAYACAASKRKGRRLFRGKARKIIAETYTSREVRDSIEAEWDIIVNRKIAQRLPEYR